MKKAIKNIIDKIFYRAFPELSPFNEANAIKKELNEIKKALEPYNINLTDFVEYTLQNDAEIFQFYKIKKITNGYLAPEIYREIYRSAYNSPEGYIIDIGPAQGGSAISLGLGLKHSGKTNSKVFSIEKGEGSSALISPDKALNESKLVSNIAAYDLADYSVVLMGDVREVSPQVPDDKPVSCIFIDADGALDRDFDLFFNRMPDKAFIIIDDYANIINKLAFNNYLRWKTQEEMDSYVRRKGAESFTELCPLGKEYTTFQFVNYFLESGLIEKEKMIGTTLFARKKSESIFNEDHLKDLKQIRENILDEYYSRNTALKRL